MKISDLLRLSTDNLRRRKGRTALTVIGVVVGTFAIIVMISLGIASNAQNEAMLQSWGDLTQTPELSRRLRRGEMETTADYMRALDLPGFCQERTSAREEYTPPFDLTGV